MRFLTADQLDELAEQFGERHQVMILVAGYLGLRWSELVGLTTDDVQLPAGRLTVSHAVVEVNGHLLAGPPKTSTSFRR